MVVPTRRVLVVEDEALTASLIAKALNGAGFETAIARDVSSARRAVDTFDPDVALLDISLGDGPSGLDLGQALHITRPDIALVFLTRHADVRTVGDGHTGVPPGSGYLRKDEVSDTEVVVAALDAVLTEQQVTRHDLRSERPLAELTAHQLEVLGMAAQGLTNKAIAKRRGVSEKSVEMLMHAVFAALGIRPNSEVNPRVEAVRRYVDANGLPSRP